MHPFVCPLYVHCMSKLTTKLKRFYSGSCTFKTSRLATLSISVHMLLVICFGVIWNVEIHHTFIVQTKDSTIFLLAVAAAFPIEKP